MASDAEQALWQAAHHISQSSREKDLPLPVYVTTNLCEWIDSVGMANIGQDLLKQQIFPAISVDLNSPESIYYWLVDIYLNNNAPGWFPAVLTSALIDAAGEYDMIPDSPVIGQNIISTQPDSQLTVYQLEMKSDEEMPPGLESGLDY